MGGQTTARFQVFGAGVLSFAAVVGAGSVLIATQGGPERRYASEYAPVDAGAALPGLRSKLDEPVAAASAPAPRSVPAPSPRDGMILPVTGDALDGGGQIAGFDNFVRPVKIYHLGDLRVGGASTRPPPSQSQAASPVPSPRESPVAAREKPRVPPRRGLERGGPVPASRVHYGANSRVGLMSRGAGPVYNFGGFDRPLRRPRIRGAGTSHRVDAKVDEAEQRLDGAALTLPEKASLRRELDEIREVADRVDAR